MSHADPLKSMAEALRRSRTGGSADVAATKARILFAASATPRRRRATTRWFFPIAAVLVMSGAFAATSPAARHLWGRYAGRSISSGEVARFTPLREAAMANATNEGLLVEPSPEAPPEPPLVAAAVPIVAPPAPRVRATPVAETSREPRGNAKSENAPTRTAAVDAAKAAKATAEVPRVAEDADNRLYAEAHEAHFVQHNARIALGAWDAYLTQWPSGRFSLEARYNRALCLVRLEQFDEARAALEPFAAGQFGDYRRREAKRLLEALERR
jgi:hypothetical protein